ncbi:hypothetical protein GCM10012286_42510 [Streptomyces lasiicapitis]|uniref:Uncharacterized protein n=1 Tax=Streptomyces lasiicapitis TaxID=1923961 RepID=A0ABQ2M6Y4_9ACTN|nr:hypothetical protein GCM10012286_42510 [Streptomyces lasiicapitis]
MLVEDARRLAALAMTVPEALVKTGGTQRGLPGLLVDVQHAALGAGGRGRVEVEDGGLDAVQVQDAGERETAEARADY